MVYESSTVFPTPEGAQLTSPPPISTYGFQKLASEYFAKGAWEQYQLPYTIVRPFNCVGIGERRALRDTDIMSGNVKLALSHVVPDLVHKILKGQDPLHILGAGDQVRHYTYGGDLAHGIRLAMESPAAVNDDFNLSTAASTTVLELAEAIWHKIHTDGRPFHYVSDAPFEHDVQLRVPDVRKAREVLGFEATTTLDQMLDEVIPWIRAEAGGRAPVTRRAGALGRHAGLQGGRGGRAGPPGADRGDRDAARDPRRLRLRRGPDGPGHRAAGRRAADGPRPAQRPRSGRAQRDEGRASPRRAGAYVLISMADGSDEPHVVDPMVALARDGRGRRLRVALHARWPPDRRTAAQAADEPDRRADPALVRRRADPRPDQQLQALLAPLPRHGDDREHGGLRARPRADRQGHASPGAASPRSRRPGATGPPARATSSSASGCRTTCTGTGRRSAGGSAGSRGRAGRGTECTSRAERSRLEALAAALGAASSQAGGSVARRTASCERRVGDRRDRVAGEPVRQRRPVRGHDRVEPDRARARARG